jgi:predicted metal-dependent hydrolase
MTLSLSKIFRTSVVHTQQQWIYKGQVVRLNPLKRARNIRLAYDSKRHHFRLTTPVHITKREIEKFLIHADPWFDERIQQNKELIKLDHGSTVSILGQPCRIHFQKDIKRKVVFDSDTLIVSDHQNKHVELLEDEIKKQSLEFLTKKSHEFAEKLDVSIQKVIIRDTYSRWGSCAASGNLSYSWRLIFAPLEIAEYVCAHEVSHRKYMDHSKAFWQTVSTLCPNYRKHRAWLKTEGKQLFRYKF